MKNLLWMFSAMLLAIAPVVVAAHADPGSIPANAHAKRHGGGWKCEANDECVWNEG